MRITPARPPAPPLRPRPRSPNLNLHTSTAAPREISRGAAVTAALRKAWAPSLTDASSSRTAILRPLTTCLLFSGIPLSVILISASSALCPLDDVGIPQSPHLEAKPKDPLDVSQPPVLARRRSAGMRGSGSRMRSNGVLSDVEGSRAASNRPFFAGATFRAPLSQHWDRGLGFRQESLGK